MHVKCIYAPNDNMNFIGPDNESKAFFKEVFDDSDEDKYTHKLIEGDFNVALSHTNDTLGYLQVNNPNSREYLTRQAKLCNLEDIWRLKNPSSRQYTFSKKQTIN